jgi:toxin-antitoxin system PIN domain toxin
MIIAVDTNILVYSHRRESPFHLAAVELVEKLLAGSANWAIPWPCIHEFYAVVTNPRIFKVPTPPTIAFDAIRSWSQGGNLIMLAEHDGYLEKLREISTAAKINGARIHDARIAALCLYHGISQLWSADRDLSLFPSLDTRNPLV